MDMIVDSSTPLRDAAPFGADLEAFARVEVKASLRIGDIFFLATQHGLCRWDRRGALAPVAGLPAGEVRALGPAPGGMVLAVGGRILLADGTARIEAACDGPAGEKVAAASAASGRILLGTKTGVFGREGEGWTRLLGGPGFEVIRLWEAPGRILVSVKKQGAARRPALAESLDGGVTWSVEEMGDYGDVVLAADARRIVTRWRGARPRGVTPHGYKKHPLSGAELLPDGGVLVFDGDKAEIAGPGRRKAEIFHPMIAEAEQAHLLPEGILLSGMQGAFLFDPLTWRMQDLAQGLFAERVLGKRKRLFKLDGMSVLATCSFGTFLSEDGGLSWAPADGEWDVLDAERIARAPDGRYFLLCQRGLFVSRDNGRRWDYAKPKLPHGSRHYGEFRSLAIGDGKIWMGTKQGLFAASLEAPDKLAPVANLAAASIEVLHFEQDAGGLLMGMEGHGLSVLGSDGTVRRLGDVALHEATLLRDGAVLLAASEEKLFAIGFDGAVADVTPEGAHGPIAITAGAGRVLVWDRKRAWQRSMGGTGWQVVPGWPADIRSVALLPDGRAVMTDRAGLSALDLADVC